LKYNPIGGWYEQQWQKYYWYAKEKYSGLLPFPVVTNIWNNQNITFFPHFLFALFCVVCLVPTLLVSI
jgi:hypothetical protein